MTIKQYLSDRISKGTLHIALLDPEKQSAETAGKIARKMRYAKSDAIMIGGSTGVTSENLSRTATAIKECSGLPTIHFPNGPYAISPNVDSIMFICMMNSTDIKWIMDSQVRAAPSIKKLGIETIPVGYIVVEPGMKVGEIGKANLIRHNEINRAVAYAIACQMYGMEYVYLEAGSGAYTPVPPTMISAVKSSIDIPLIVGGGIRTPDRAIIAREAGADIIVTGTFIERCNDDDELRAIVEASKGA